MNRRQKIIISVTGIFIALLVLLGLTYAYFLTRITGNGNPTSISVTTANLELVYGDGTTALLTSATPIEPGKFSSSKDFTVTNSGNTLADYAVTLEDFSITYAADTVIDGVYVKAGTVTKMEYPEDMKMTITCTIESDDNTRNGTACGNTNGTLPTENSILLTNSIEVDDIHKYVLTLTYVDSGIDQSKDMNKTIKGKIDIIDPKSTIDLTGTVASYQTGDYVEINSTPVKSEIIDGKYTLIGVEPGSHTLNIKYKDTNGDIQTRVSETLTIKKGEEASVSGSIITFTDASRLATVDVTSSYGIIVDETIKKYNPYKEGTLAYNIINNSLLNKYGTTLLNKPITKPGTTSKISYKTHEVEIGDRYRVDINTTYQGYYWTYATDYIVDESTGKFSLLDPKVCLYNDTNLSDNTNNECDELISTMVSKGETIYIINSSASSNANKTPTLKNTTNLYNIYLVTEAPLSSSSTIYMIAKKMSSISYSTEKVLSITRDDYGTSYYYRGGVEDNYVNFAGLCWRIVRIEGDGSVKLILEDRNTECNSESFTGNWSDGKGYAFGYDNNNRVDFINYNGGLADSFKTFQNTLSTKISEKYSGKTLLDKLKVDEWCYDDRVTETGSYECDLDNDEEYESMCIFEEYGTSTRIDTANPSLNCSGTKLTKFSDNTSMFVGTLTADEITFSGAAYSSHYNFYLMNSFKRTWWTISPMIYEEDVEFDSAFNLSSSGDMSGIDGVDSKYYSRPAITLKTGTRISSGEGTLEKPYIIG